MGISNKIIFFFVSVYMIIIGKLFKKLGKYKSTFTYMLHSYIYYTWNIIKPKCYAWNSIIKSLNWSPLLNVSHSNTDYI